MRAALDATDFSDRDSRVRPAIEDFILTLMEKYKQQYNFATGEEVYGCSVEEMMARVAEGTNQRGRDLTTSKA